LIIVLSSKNEQRAAKGKEAAIAKWEEETRKQIASKKAQPATLTKQQEAAVKKQLEVEEGIRRQVVKVKSDFERGLNLVKSLVASGSADVGAHVPRLADLLVTGPLKDGAFLVGDLAFETYLVENSRYYTLAHC
jgi:hypothetical protein